MICYQKKEQSTKPTLLYVDLELKDVAQREMHRPHITVIINGLRSGAGIA